MNREQFLSSSLQYKLKLYCESIFGNHILPLVVENLTNDLRNGVNVNQAKSLDLIPIVHQFSDILKEIEHDGKKFIPIVELARLELSPINKNINTQFPYEITLQGIKYKPYLSFGIYKFIYDTNEKCFIKTSENGETHEKIRNQVGLISKLIEWHFNLMDESEPFIDVNILPENPYK